MPSLLKPYHSRRPTLLYRPTRCPVWTNASVEALTAAKAALEYAHVEFADEVASHGYNDIGEAPPKSRRVPIDTYIDRCQTFLRTPTHLFCMESSWVAEIADRSKLFKPETDLVLDADLLLYLFREHIGDASGDAYATDLYATIYDQLELIAKATEARAEREENDCFDVRARTPYTPLGAYTPKGYPFSECILTPAEVTAWQQRPALQLRYQKEGKLYRFELGPFEHWEDERHSVIESMKALRHLPSLPSPR